MHRKNWRLRPAWERAVAVTFTSLFAWTFIAAPPLTALAQYQKPNTQYYVPGFRHLSAKEMASIRGKQVVGGGPQHAISLAADAGPTYPWEGSSGDANTGNGNKMTTVPIVGWTQRGGMPVNFSLYHNSEGTHNSELGQKWTFSYDIYLVSGGSSGGSGGSGGMMGAGGGSGGASNMAIHWGDDLSYVFTNDGSNNFTPPTGIHDTLVLNVDGSFTLTKPDQTKYHFNTAYYCDTITDENGNAISISHNTGGYVTSVSDATNRTITVGYDGSTALSIAREFKHPDIAAILLKAGAKE